MFDSAFGGGSGSGFGSSTGAPTQAMETPMFGQGGGDQQGFAPGAFGGGGGSDFNMGTPAPDFSPDTDMRAPMGRMPAASEPGGGGKGGSPLALIIAAVIALIVGIGAGPYISGMVPFLPNPMKAELETVKSEADLLRSENAKQKAEIARIATSAPDGIEVSKEEETRLRESVLKLTEDLAVAQAKMEEVSGDLATREAELATLDSDFIARSDEFEVLKNETSITTARRNGLKVEVDRLTSQVGELEEADVRRAATKDALAHAVDRLYIQVKEGLPLTPEKYDRNARVAAVETLREQLAGSKWVTPALQDAYTDLYLKELAIAQSQEYFYSKIPVVDSYGSRVHKWAECVMNGNNSVNYRTFDGKNIGVFSNMGTGEDAVWGFMEDLSPSAKKEIEDKIVANRVEGFEEKVQALAERQISLEDETGMQRAFSSL